MHLPAFVVRSRLLPWLLLLMFLAPGFSPAAEPGPLDGVLLGRWTFRSFRNDAAPSTPVADLLFGEGVMTIISASDGVVTGTFDYGPGYQMAFKGVVTYGNPVTLQFLGKGMGEGNRDWLYDCNGQLGFQFPQAVDQVPSLMGTIVRAQAHSGGQAPAGVTASWIAVKQGMGGGGGALMAGDKPAAGVDNEKGNGARAMSTRLRTPGRAYLEDDAARAAHPAPDPGPAKVLKATGNKRAGGGNLNLMRAPTPGLAPAPPPAPAPAPPKTKPSLTPETVTSGKDGILHLDLTLDYNKAELKIGNDAVHLRTYNGKLVGPVMRCKAGDTLSIDLHNNLPDVPPVVPDPPGTTHNGHHDWNVTNLHFHGLHVAPQGTPEAESDNVLLRLLPQKSQHYEVHIPSDHPAGTFWYHAHSHGSTAAQVSGGVAGALIIDRTDNVTNLDAIPEIAAAAQEIMVLQAVAYLPDPNTKLNDIELYNIPNPPPSGIPASGSSADVMFGPGAFFKLKRNDTVNGLMVPTITMAPGEVRRLRLIASGQREFVQLRIARDADGNVPDSEKILFNEVAVDGLVTGRINQTQDLKLQPGYRSDALVQVPADAKGTYYLVDMNIATQAKGAFASDDPTRRTSLVAKIVIDGAPLSMGLPDPAALLKQRLPDLTETPDPDPQHAYYAIVIAPNGDALYYLSEDDVPPGAAPAGREFDSTQTRYLPLGHTQKWQVGSRNSNNIQAAHPFHIHINPFLISAVTDANGKDVLEKEFGGTVWRDTLAMTQGYTYTLLTKYERYTGSFVDHCHILDHEDNGMMEKVTIYDPAVPPLSTPLGGLRMAPASLAADAVLKPAAGRPTLAVVIRSVDCGLCRDQVKAFEKAAGAPGWPKGLDLVFVAPDPAERVQAFQAQGIIKKGRLVADPQGAVLNAIDAGAKAEDRGHGILLLDGTGAPLIKSASTEPLLDPKALQPHFDQLKAGTAAAAPATPGAGGGWAGNSLSPSVAIDVWNTPTPDDDYVTWAPTPCTIRLTTPQAQDVQVTLTNDPQGPVPSGRTQPLDGDVAFAAQLAQGQTAQAPTLTLTLPKDGSPVSFFIAGKFPRASTRDKDCVIEVHNGANAAAPLIGSHALMVRVRKDHRALTDYERQRFLSALDYLHRTATAPEGGDMYMHYVRMHKAAAFGLNYDPDQPPGTEPQYGWPDLAHKGPGFISWHRAFLLAFERTIQEHFPDVSLPYWVMPEPSLLFTPDFMGSNPSDNKPSTVATFATTNPLYGWTADIDGAVNQPVMRRGYGRNPGDAGFGPFFTDKDLFTLTHYSYFPLWAKLDKKNPDITDPANSFASTLEQNPHNSGHNWVGPWMANCETSPRDPIFWVFHAGFDRQWAKWQLTYNRFNPDGSEDSFCPSGTFENPGPLCDPKPPPAPDCNSFASTACVPVNHHLADQLWPWNGKSGQAATQNGSYPEQEMAFPFLAPFPAAPIAGLYPATPTAVTNGDMIDFMGKTPGRLPMGFCYDDTPYDKAGLATAPPLLAVAPATAPMAAPSPGAAVAGARLDIQRSASLALSDSKQERNDALKSLRQVQEDPKADVNARRSALRVLAQSGDTELPLKIAASTSPAHAPLKAEAVRLASEFMMFTPEGRTRKKEVMKVLEKNLTAPDQETRSEALWSLLGPHVSKDVLDLLTAAISGKAGAKFPVDEALRALNSAGKAKENADLIRPVLGSKDPAAVAAAATALAGDAASAPERTRLLRDGNAPPAVRSAALQSLSPADPAQVNLVLGLVTDPATSPSLRAEAAAQIGLWARSSEVKLTAQQLSTLRETLGALPPAATRGLEAPLAQTLRHVNERLAKGK